MHRMFVAAVPASSDGEALGREALCSTKGLPALACRTYPFLPMRYGSAVLAAFVSISGSHVFLCVSGTFYCTGLSSVGLKNRVIEVGNNLISRM